VALAQKLGMPSLVRAWQILLKGLSEVQQAPVPMQALEMVIIRLAFTADLPPPGDLVRRIMDGAGRAAPGPAPAGGPGPGGGLSASAGRAVIAGGGAVARMVEPQMAVSADLAANPTGFREVVQLFTERREGILAGMLRSAVHLVRFEPGVIEFRPQPSAPQNLAGRVGQLLTEWTGRRWLVSVSGAPGEPTLTDQEQAAELQLRSDAAEHPAVRALLEAFPGARIEAVREPAPPPPEPAPPAAGAEDEYFVEASPMGDGDEEWDGDF
jgi:DNA polymerase-3 subunit gamma/tau